jgi:hypothetical protein
VDKEFWKVSEEFRELWRAVWKFARRDFYWRAIALAGALTMWWQWQPTTRPTTPDAGTTTEPLVSYAQCSEKFERRSKGVLSDSDPWWPPADVRLGTHGNGFCDSLFMSSPGSARRLVSYAQCSEKFAKELCDSLFISSDPPAN